MTDDTVILIAAILLVLEAIACVLAALGVSRFYHERLVDSLMFRKLRDRDLRIAVASAVIAVIVVYSLVREPFGWPLIPRPWGSLVIVGAIAVLMWGPIADWWTIRRLRRDRGDGAPPPWAPGD